MANNWNYNDFQNWFCEKFKKPNPLPWQDAMGAIIDYITNEIPDNMQVVLNKLTSGVSSATLHGNGTPLEPFVLTINLSMVDFKGDTGATGPQGPQGATGPQGPQGATGAGIDTLDQIELTSISSMTYDTTNGWQVVYTAVLDYGNGDTHTATATARLPIKPGDNVTIDVAADGKSLIIKAKSLHLYYLTDGGEVPLKDFIIPIICDTPGLTNPSLLIDKVYADAGVSSLRLPAMGTTAGNGYVVGMVMTSDDKTNGSFKIYTTTDDTGVVEISKCGVILVY